MSKTRETDPKTKMKDFWLKYEPKIVLAAAFVLVAIISFEAGTMKKADFGQKPLVIEKPAEIAAVAGDQAQKDAPQAQNSAADAVSNPTGSATPPSNCAFVGSKNSNKYHLPTCRYAKNISPQNIVCFSSADDAKSKGYQPDKNCVK